MTNEEALAAESEMCRAEGVFICPEVATTLVGARKAVESGIVAEKDSVVLIGTATGLKSLSHVRDPMIWPSSDETGDRAPAASTLKWRR